MPTMLEPVTFEIGLFIDHKLGAKRRGGELHLPIRGLSL